MSFNNGDVVRIGKGKVEYTISEFNEDGTVNLTGEKSNRRNVDTATLTLVHSDWIQDADVADAVDFSAMPGPVAIPENEIMAPWEIELLHGGVNPARPFLLTVDGVTSDHKTYNAACDALIIAARKGIQVYAVIDHNGQRKAERKAV